MCQKIRIVARFVCENHLTDHPLYFSCNSRLRKTDSVFLCGVDGTVDMNKKKSDHCLSHTHVTPASRDKPMRLTRTTLMANVLIHRFPQQEKQCDHRLTTARLSDSK